MNENEKKYVVELTEGEVDLAMSAIICAISDSASFKRSCSDSSADRHYCDCLDKRIFVLDTVLGKLSLSML